MKLGRAHGGAAAALWCGPLVHGALLLASLRLDDDRLTAGLATVSFAVVLASGLRLLRLPPLAPSMVYFYVLGCFHLGLATPWALGVASDPLPDWFVQHRLTPALALTIAAFGCYQFGLSWAVLRRGARSRRPPSTLRFSASRSLRCRDFRSVSRPISIRRGSPSFCRGRTPRPKRWSRSSRRGSRRAAVSPKPLHLLEANQSASHDDAL